MTPENLRPEPGERRQDFATRRRIAVIERRFHRVSRALLIGVAVSAVASLLGIAGAIIAVDRVQESRLRIITLNCERDNEEALAIHQFVGEAGGPRLRKRAELAFPVQPDCRAYARARVRLR